MSLNCICSLLLLLLATNGYATPTANKTNSHNDCVQTRAIGSIPRVALITPEGRTCSGALISNRHILVAGHCASLEGTKEVGFPSSMTTFDKAESSITKHKVSKISIHPEFKQRINDIAIVHFATPLDLKAEKLIPVCLPQSDSEAVSNVSLFTSTIHIHHSYSRNRYVYTFHEYDFVTMSSDECQKKYGTLTEINASQICANSKNNNKKEGKAGGSMMGLSDGHYYIMGLSSFGVNGDYDYPEVFTRVWSYLNWIEGVVNTIEVDVF